MGKETNISKYDFKKNKYGFIHLLTNSLRYNGIESLEDLYLTPLDLVLVVNKGSAHGGYLPLYMVGELISVKNSFVCHGLTRISPLWLIYI